MHLSLLHLLPLILEKLQGALGAHKPLCLTGEAARLTLGGYTFQLVPLVTFRGKGPRPEAEPAGPPSLPSIAVAEYIPRQVAETLRQQGQCYADAMGNFWVQGPAPALLLFSTGARHRKLVSTQGAAFQVQGLRLLFHLLHQPELVQRPAADLARHTRVPRRAVSAALRDLLDEGFLPAPALGLVRLPELAARWATAYRATLRPQLPTQRYRWQPSWRAGRPAWFALARKTQSLLGGSVAARRLLACPLTPDTFTLYTHAQATAGLLQKAGLEPHKDGPVEVIHLFAVPLVFPEDYCIHPLLIYADLLTTDNTESQQVAQQLLAHYLPHLAQ